MKVFEDKELTHGQKAFERGNVSSGEPLARVGDGVAVPWFPGRGERR
jgi:hypothetical protein